LVFVEDAAEDPSSPYGRVDRHDHARVVVGRPLIPALLWTMAVEMPFIGGQYGAGVSFVVNQDMVSALPACAANEPLGVTVHSQRPRRDLHHFDAYGGEHRMEGTGELRVPVTDQEPERRRPTTNNPQWTHQQICQAG
jgi:hypothetical protein